VTVPIYTVDAFSDGPFGGNPAGVCLLGPGVVTGESPAGVPARQDDPWMQSVAAEMNLAETAFLSPLGDGRFRLRWFTPAVEVDLCGHATLASAHVLWERGDPSPVLGFETRSGLLTAERVDGGIRLDFPADPVTPVDTPDRLVAALGVEPVSVHRGVSDFLVEVASSEIVRKLALDFRALASFTEANRAPLFPARGVIVTAGNASAGRDGDGDDADTGADFVSRCFYPAAGVDEDPVTGSAHCTLASFWCPRLGRSSLVGWQASARGGRVGVELAGDRVLLTGRAVTVLWGQLV